MKVPFCLPLIDQDVVDEVNDALTGTGWITSGPKVKALEEEFQKLTGAPGVICVNSWVSGTMLVLRWFGIGPGDEVIIPAYTYSATALAVMNIGAKVKMVDVGKDFNMDPIKMKRAITKRTKAILPVDIGGLPCDYDRIFEVLALPEIAKKFTPKSDKQEMLGRPLVLADSAHSIGATYKGKQAGTYADVCVFSLHSVKNITTAEGGTVCINLPAPFDNQAERDFLKVFSLNGQNKSAFQKNQLGGWRYDIIAQGLKVNLPDICAAIGLAQIRKYSSELLPERKAICARYIKAFKKEKWAIMPPFKDKDRDSSCHLFLLRMKGIEENQRDQIIDFVAKREVGVNVHYIPMAMLTFFKNEGLDIKNYPKTYDNYKSVITLPVYNGLSMEAVDHVAKTIIEAYNHVVGEV